jgi:hypothetical protein
VESERNGNGVGPDEGCGVGPHVGEPICDMDVWPSPVILV